MAEQTRRVLADKVHVAMTVEVGQLRTLARDHRQREWLEVQDRTGVTAWQIL
jgi:hypothetical protein